MASLLITLLSIGLQLSAAYLALRLVRASGRHLGWIALSAGFTLMALRRIVELHALLDRGLGQASLDTGEFIGVGNAALMFLGTLRIKTYIESARGNAQALVESEAHARAVLDALPDICFRLDAEGTVLFLDPKGHETSFDPPRAVGLRIEDSGVSPELAEFLRTLLRDTLNEGRGLQREVTVPLQCGNRVREVRTNPSGPSEVLFLVRDITDRKTLETGLQAQIAFNKALLDAIPLPVFYKDREGRYLGCNQAFADSLGRPIPEIVGKRVEELFRADLAARYRKADEELFQRGGAQIYEARMWHAEAKEERDGRFIKATFRGAGGEIVGLVGVMEDITDRKRSEETLRYAQKMESLGIMAGGIAHDFNNLFQAIQGNLEVAQLLGFQEGAPAQALTRALASVAKAAELSKRMLEYAGRVGGNLEHLDLGQLLRENEGRFAALLPARTRLRLEVPADSAPIEGNRQELAQVLAALVANAGEAIGNQGGEVIISLEQRSPKDQELKAGFWAERPPEGARLCLRIQDDGCGMNMQAQSRMFDPFFTTKEAGRGLGLPSALGILRAHHAGLQIASVEGQGTAVCIFFEAETAAGPADDPKPPEASAPAGRAILLVDDEPVVREGVAELIRRGLGREVFEARNGQEALELLGQHGARIGFVLMDASMPGETGMEVFERIRGIRPDLQGLLCSGYSGTFGQEAAAQHGFAGFLAKPFGFRELKKALEAFAPVV